MSCCGDGSYYNDPNAVVVPMDAGGMCCGCSHQVNVGFVDARLVGPLVTLQEWQEGVRAFNEESRKASPCAPVPCSILFCFVIFGLLLFIPLMVIFYDEGSVVCDLPNGICKENQDPIDDDCCSFFCCPKRLNKATVPTTIQYPMPNATLHQLVASYTDDQCSEYPGKYSTEYQYVQRFSGLS